MAKDGDIIDFLFSTMISFFGWILGLLLKLVMLITVGLVKGIISLFKKNEAPAEQ